MSNSPGDGFDLVELNVSIFFGSDRSNLVYGAVLNQLSQSACDGPSSCSTASLSLGSFCLSSSQHVMPEGAVLQH